MITKIYYVYYNEEFEYQAFFDENYNYISGWNMNDANWRPEYMNGLFVKLGIEVVRTWKYPEIEKILLSKLNRLFIEWGLNE